MMWDRGLRTAAYVCQGQLTNIVEVEYYDRTTYSIQVELGRPHIRQGIQNRRLWPYVLTFQVDQVFYVEDGRNADWVCAVRTKSQNVYDVGQGERSHDVSATYHECVLLVLATADLHDTNDEFKHDRPDIDPIEASVG
jgi:hypothetical protein